VDELRPNYLNQARQAFESALNLVTAEWWASPTKCDPWTVADLVTHVIAVARAYSVLLDGASTEEAVTAFYGVTKEDEPCTVGIDGSPRSAASEFGLLAGAVQRQLDVAEIRDRTVHHPLGDVTGHQLGGYAMLEWVIHGWDLSTAMYRESTIDADLAEAIYDAIFPLAERLRDVGDVGTFGPPVAVPDGAPAADRLLALIGRSPSGTAA
jgi:uncharacterized protein (TIGR03086 family)